MGSRITLFRHQLYNFKQAFNQCDVDGSGRIDIKELHIGLLILYDKINQVLPIHYPVPSKYEVTF